jgi:hypothetical protein
MRAHSSCFLGAAHRDARMHVGKGGPACSSYAAAVWRDARLLTTARAIGSADCIACERATCHHRDDGKNTAYSS